MARGGGGPFAISCPVMSQDVAREKEWFPVNYPAQYHPIGRLVMDPSSPRPDITPQLKHFFLIIAGHRQKYVRSSGQREEEGIK